MGEVELLRLEGYGESIKLAVGGYRTDLQVLAAVLDQSYSSVGDG